jgi:uncharacterized membrane protein YdjX (TVP38/TMEM64 family)
MTPTRFGVALMLGSLPPALLYSYIGSTAKETPVAAGLLMVAITAGCWLVFLRLKGCTHFSEND